MNEKSSKILAGFIIIGILVIGVFFGKNYLPVKSVQNNVAGKNSQGEETKSNLNPLSIEYLKVLIYNSHCLFPDNDHWILNHY